MKLQSIQVLRGLAAFAVAMAHLVSFERDAIAENGFREPGLTGGIWLNGFAGVDLFFVISGFIMVYVTTGRERGVVSSGDFILARAARIYPLWWLFMVAMGGVFLVVHNTPFHPEEIAKTDASALSYILKSTFLIPQEPLPILGVGWTLIHEMYFYIVFATFLLLPERILPLLLACWAALVGLGYAAGYSNPSADTVLHLVTHPMTIEFCLGTMAGLIFYRCSFRFGFVLASVSAALFLASMLFFQNSDAIERGIWATDEWGRIIVFGVPAAFLVCGLAATERSRSIPFPNWLVGLGNISFALYLCHPIVFIAVGWALQKASFATEHFGLPIIIVNSLKVGSPGIADNLIFGAVCLSVAVLTAVISYKIFEQPSLQFLTRFRRKHVRNIKFNSEQGIGLPGPRDRRIAQPIDCE